MPELPDLVYIEKRLKSDLAERKIARVRVYLIEENRHEQIPGYNEQGVDILSRDFTFERFAKLIEKKHNQVRVFIMDQRSLSAIGNGYADEILFAAGIHPKTLCSQLSESDIERLYNSIKEVINWGITEVARAAEPVEVKVRGHMKVRNRMGRTCTLCGATIRRVGVLGYDAFFCPRCQPPLREQFINWT